MNIKENANETANAKDGLDDYIRISSPGILATIAAMVLVVTALIVWGLTGRLPVTETVTGVVADATKDYASGMNYMKKINVSESKEGKNENIYVLCFLDASRFNLDTVRKIGEKTNDSVVLEMPDHTKFTGKIVMKQDSVPVNRAQAYEILFANDWLADTCIKGEYSWPVLIRPDEDLSAYEFTLANVTIVTDEIAPFQLLVR